MLLPVIIYFVIFNWFIIQQIEYPAPVTEENNTGMWYIRFKRFCKFVEACRIVLIQCRMLRRLEILKVLLIFFFRHF